MTTMASATVRLLFALTVSHLFGETEQAAESLLSNPAMPAATLVEETTVMLDGTTLPGSDTDDTFDESKQRAELGSSESEVPIVTIVEDVIVMLGSTAFPGSDMSVCEAEDTDPCERNFVDDLFDAFNDKADTEVLCSHANSLLSCLGDLTCQLRPEYVETTRSKLKSLLCQVECEFLDDNNHTRTAAATDITTTAPTATKNASGEGTSVDATTTATKTIETLTSVAVPSPSVFERKLCKQEDTDPCYLQFSDDILDAYKMGANQETMCGHANKLMTCLEDLACQLQPGELDTSKSKIKSALLLINCEILNHTTAVAATDITTTAPTATENASREETSVVDATTTATKTIETLTSVAVLSSSVFERKFCKKEDTDPCHLKFSDDILDAYKKGANQETMCGHANKLMTCLEDLACQLHPEELHTSKSKIKSALLLLNCEILDDIEQASPAVLSTTEATKSATSASETAAEHTMTTETTTTATTSAVPTTEATPSALTTTTATATTVPITEATSETITAAAESKATVDDTVSPGVDRNSVCKGSEAYRCFERSNRDLGDEETKCRAGDTLVSCMNDLDCEVLPIEKAWLEISIEREMDLRNCGATVTTMESTTAAATTMKLTTTAAITTELTTTTATTTEGTISADSTTSHGTDRRDCKLISDLRPCWKRVLREFNIPLKVGDDKNTGCRAGDALISCFEYLDCDVSPRSFRIYIERLQTFTGPLKCGAKAATMKSTSTAATTMESTKTAVTTMESTTAAATTMESTTAAVTTMESTTAAVTNMESTTAAVTTMESTTAAATTMESTKTALSTMESTTAAATTMESTKTAVTNMESTKAAATTMESTTAAATTIESTTAAATTMESTTAAATTMESTTAAATTMESTNAAATTNELITATATTTETTTSADSTTSRGTDGRDCMAEHWMCGKAFRHSLRTGDKTKESSCKSINIYVSCLMSTPCPMSISEEKIIEGAMAFIKHKAPDCKLEVDTEQITTSGETERQTTRSTTLFTSADISTTAAQLKDCTAGKWLCTKAFRSSIKRGEKSPESVCRYVNTYVSCLMKLSCMQSEEEKDEILEGARAFIKYRAPGCVHTDLQRSRQTSFVSTLRARQWLSSS